jgi:class I fructose-bisphosphate aldolase
LISKAKTAGSERQHLTHLCYNPGRFINKFHAFAPAPYYSGGKMATELKRGTTSLDRIEELLGDNARTLLDHQATAITKDTLNLPGPDFIDRVWSNSDRSTAVLRSLQTLFDNGRLARTGYLSILPVDQGIEHSAGASFAPNPQYFDPENIVKLAIEGGCNAVASTFGVLGTVARKYAHKIPFIVKINHNELLTLPNKFDQVLFGTVKEAHNMGAVAVGATIYFGSEESTRQITEISAAFAQAHELGMACILWCYLRNSKFKTPEGDMHASADLTGQANHLGVTIQADIIKQKLPERNGGYTAVEKELGKSYGKTSKLIYEKLTTDNPIDLVRYQVANCYMGRCGLINSGGESKGAGDLAEAVRTAVINKRGGGTGLILGRKAFQRPMTEGIELLNAIQDVYLSEEITVA